MLEDIEIGVVIYRRIRMCYLCLTYPHVFTVSLVLEGKRKLHFIPYPSYTVPSFHVNSLTLRLPLLPTFPHFDTYMVLEHKDPVFDIYRDRQVQ